MTDISALCRIRPGHYIREIRDFGGYRGIRWNDDKVTILGDNGRLIRECR